MAAHLRRSAEAVQAALGLCEQVERLGEEICEVLAAGRKVAFAGNGGSAAEAQHLATELTVRYARERQPLPALALGASSVELTACGNDYGFEHVFARQVQALLGPGDLLVLLTTSGRSPDLIAAARVARALGVRTWALTGPAGGPLCAEVDEAVRAPGATGAQVQEVHLAFGHALCEIIDRWAAQG